jgi:serine/threonine protein kinase
MKISTDQIINQRYKIIEKLDQGGMGAVWKAIDTNLGDEVALKVPLETNNAQILRRFGDEIETMRKLAKHCPFVLNILDVGNIGERPFYVMPFLEGGSLRTQINARLAKSEQTNVTWPPESFQWLGRIAEALDFLHGEDCLHRDVKPENILFSGTAEAVQTPFLADFGIVKDLNADHSMHTDPRAAIGSWAYMAPEVLADAEYSPRSDQYALAVSVYEVISGEHPFAGSNLYTLRDAFDKGHRKLADLNGQVPAAASAAVDRALSLSSEHRFENCLGFANAFTDGLKAKRTTFAPTSDSGEEAETSQFDREKYREQLQHQQASASGGLNLADSISRERQETGNKDTGNARNPRGKVKTTAWWFAGAAAVAATALLVGLFFGGMFDVTQTSDNDASIDRPSSGAAGGANIDQLGNDSIENKIQESPSLPNVLERAKSVLVAFQNNTSDYTATLTSQVMIDRRLQEEQVRLVKIRLGKAPLRTPDAVYTKQVSPRPREGQESIWENKQNENMQLSHSTGFMNIKIIKLDPNSELAMAGNRLPINHLGMGNLVKSFIENLRKYPDGALGLEEDRDTIRFSVVHGDRSINSDYQTMKLTVKKENGLPVSFETYGWPEIPDDDPRLLESYHYTDIEINTGLTPDDFDPSNLEYDFPES